MIDTDCSERDVRPFAQGQRFGFIKQGASQVSELSLPS